MKKLMVKDEGGKEIIVEVGLAVISVALLIVYRAAITNLVTELVDECSKAIRSLFQV